MHWLQMKTKFFLGVIGLSVAAVGCVGTVSGKKVAAVPFMKDRIVGRYERPASQVYDTAKEVLKFNGALLNETTLHGGTNIVLALEGRVNQRKVWISVEQIDPKVTSVIVQSRTRAGGRDLDLVHELEKQIALKLAR